MERAAVAGTLTAEAGTGMPITPSSGANAAPDPQAFVIRQVRDCSCEWCIGHVWPGATPGQHSSEITRAANASGAAIPSTS